MSDVAPDVGRHAVLVDAGYLYASVGQLVLGRTSRREFRVAAEPLIGALLARAARTTPGELLRMYWYDASRDRVPTVEQRQIAALPHVKVRLGNLNSAGQQKGVDAQLRQDLEQLARHHAVTDVVLVAGDEDMVSAVEAAQAYGVRVHVWGVEPPYGVNQAERLLWEADTVEQLDADFCRPYVEVEPAPVEEAAEQPEPRDDRPAVPTPADVFAGRKHQAPAPTPARPAAGTPERVGAGLGVGAGAERPAADRPGPERPEMEAIGARIAARWLLTRGRENVADLLPGPVLPTVIDKELLVEAEEEISRSLRPYEEARRALRDGFWAKLHEEFGIQESPTPPHPTPAQPQATRPDPGQPHAGPPHAGQPHAGPPQAGPPQAGPPRVEPPQAGQPHGTPSQPAARPPAAESAAPHPGPQHPAPAHPAEAAEPPAPARSTYPTPAAPGPAAATHPGDTGHPDPARHDRGGDLDPARSGPAGHPDPARPDQGGQADPARPDRGGDLDPARSGQADPAHSGPAGHPDPDPALPGAGGHADPAHPGRTDARADSAHLGPDTVAAARAHQGMTNAHPDGASPGPAVASPAGRTSGPAGANADRAESGPGAAAR